MPTKHIFVAPGKPPKTPKDWLEQIATWVQILSGLITIWSRLKK